MRDMIYKQHPELGRLVLKLNHEVDVLRQDGLAIPPARKVDDLTQLVQTGSPLDRYAYPTEPEVESFVQDVSMLYARLRLGAGYKMGLAANHVSEALMGVLAQFSDGITHQTDEPYGAAAFKADLDGWVTSLRQAEAAIGKKPSKSEGRAVS